MSHNSHVVNGQKPDNTGAITESLGDLSDVNAISPSEGQALVFDNASSTWVVSSIGGASGVINIGQGEQDAYSNSGASSLGASTDVYFYDSAPTNTIAGATITKYLATDWVQSVTLPAGDFVIWARYAVEFSTTGYFRFALHDNANTQISSYAVIGADTTTFAFAPSVLQSRILLASATTIKLRTISVSGVNTVANQGNTPAEYAQLTIIKVA